MTAMDWVVVSVIDEDVAVGKSNTETRGSETIDAYMVDWDNAEAVTMGIDSRAVVGVETESAVGE
ncbi:hypothetical protein VPNG_05930 [Cytospora leucostoma]|uniref:Uncharacterized protein n=1 Tax=Cytospora leucostoma TaxID=1230097 RepID=A0A423XAQ0_9PEZI|nr:hypothetical protein VPNG_05930 [Cytospora leucostoma]